MEDKTTNNDNWNFYKGWWYNQCNRCCYDCEFQCENSCKDMFPIGNLCRGCGMQIE